MSKFQVLSASEQLACHMKEEVLRGIWTDFMPGEEFLLSRFGVGQGTVRAALQHLEAEGLLVAQGQGRRRRIVLPEHPHPPALRVRILPYEPSDKVSHYQVDLLHRLMEAGHVASFATRTLLDLNMDLKRVSRYIQDTPADAWIVISGPRDVLEWCAQQDTPVFAFAGRRRGIRIAGTGPDKVPALRSAVRHLIAHGHRRIVMLAREVRRKPKPGNFEQAFLDELQALGIPQGHYNLPDWKNNAEDFHRCLDSLFQHTPPTALIIEEMPTFIAAQLHLSQRGILAPRDVSLVCDDPNPVFEWCRPSIAHIHWDSAQWNRRIIQWANNIASGRDDRRQTNTKAEFVDGGTVGPVPKSQSRLRH